MDSITTLNIGGLYTDPTEYNGKNVICGYCDKEAEHDDLYCEDHQRCEECGEREICEDECIIYSK